MSEQIIMKEYDKWTANVDQLHIEKANTVSRIICPESNKTKTLYFWRIARNIAKTSLNYIPILRANDLLIYPKKETWMTSV